MGTLLGALVTHGLTSDELERWGWRIPFLFGLIIGPVGLYVRRHLAETADFAAARAAKKEASAFGSTLAAHFKAMVVCIGLSGGGSIQFYVLLIYMPTFASTQLHLPLSAALVAQAVGLAFLVLWVVLFGALADRVGPKPIMITFGAAMELVSVMFINHRTRDPRAQFGVNPAMNSVT